MGIKSQSRNKNNPTISSDDDFVDLGKSDYDLENNNLSIN